MGTGRSSVCGPAAPCSRRLLHSGRAGFLGAGIHADLPGRRRRIGSLPDPTVEGLGGSGGIVELRRRGRRHLIGVLKAAGGKSLGELRLRGSAAPNGVNGGEVPRAAEEKDYAYQRGHEAGPELVALEITPSGIYWRLGHALTHNASYHARRAAEGKSKPQGSWPLHFEGNHQLTQD
jgi:hypothetical protein